MAESNNFRVLALRAMTDGNFKTAFEADPIRAAEADGIRLSPLEKSIVKHVDAQSLRLPADIATTLRGIGAGDTGLTLEVVGTNITVD